MVTVYKIGNGPYVGRRLGVRLSGHTVEDIAPGLTGRYGIGPVSAAQAVVSFSHPAAAATKPRSPRSAVPAPSRAAAERPSGTDSPQRRPGALNRAIHTIALTRIRSCPRTRAYGDRRTAEGKSSREIRRCIKRYIAREIYRHLTQSTTTPDSA